MVSSTPLDAGMPDLTDGCTLQSTGPVRGRGTETLTERDNGMTTAAEVEPYDREATLARMQEMALGYDPDLDFRELAKSAKFISRGFRLVTKQDLVAIPHVIVGVTYREGFPRADLPGDYVSVEAVIADANTLASYPIQQQIRARGYDLTVYPQEAVVYNDSSTGIRRTFTELFHEIGIINVGAAASKNDNPFDKAFQHWDDGAARASEGITVDQDGEPFRYLALRGLRRSDYEWQPPHGGPKVPATTFYLG